MSKDFWEKLRNNGWFSLSFMIEFIVWLNIGIITILINFILYFIVFMFIKSLFF